MSVYYNEFDPYAAQWLRNLVTAGHIASGDVDERSILEVKPDDIKHYTQCHFFAGIGGWSLALRLAGWSDDRRVWTGSCPCQPFSAAGSGAGMSDERHLWPAWYHLISQCEPSIVFGEQVDAAIRHGWLDLVSTDLEGLGYAFGASGLPAASVGAPHIRQRLWFVADRRGEGLLPGAYPGIHSGEKGAGARHVELERLGAACPVAYNRRAGREMEIFDADVGVHHPDVCRSGQHSGSIFGTQTQSGTSGQVDGNCRVCVEFSGAVGVTHGDANYEGLERRRVSGCECPDQRTPWAPSNLEWLPCSDGKTRPTQPGLFPLAHGVPGRVGRLRAYGNAIVPQVAAEWIKVVMEYRP